MLNKLTSSKILIALSCALALGACSSNKDNLTPAGSSALNNGAVVDPSFTNTGSTFRSTDDVQAKIYNGYSQVQLETVTNTVYFGFDQYQPLPEYMDLIQAQAQFIKKTGAKVLLQGFTDERGTPAYNIVLGAKRAAAVANLLKSYGVDPSQIRQISYGEERPAVLGHTEQDYAKNRRVIFYYQF